MTDRDRDGRPAPREAAVSIVDASAPGRMAEVDGEHPVVPNLMHRAADASTLPSSRTHIPGRPPVSPWSLAPPRRRRSVVDILGAVALVGIGLSVQTWTIRTLDAHASYQYVLLPIALASWLFSFRATLIGILVAALAQDWFFLQPHGSLLIGSSGDCLQFGLFVVIALVIAILYERLKRAKRANHSALRELFESDRARAASKHRLDAGLNAMPDPVVMLSPVRDASGQITDFTIEYANDATKRGGDAAWVGDLGGRLLTSVAPLHALVGSTANCVAVIETGAPLDRTVGIDEAPDRTVEVRADRLGEGLLVQWRDVSEQHRAKQIIADSERHLRRMLNSLYSFVGVLLPDGTVTGVNEAPLRAAGLSAEEVVGKKFWDCHWFSYDAATQSTLTHWVEQAARGETIRADVLARTIGDARVTIDFMLSPLRDEQGRITHLIPSGADVSDRVRAQADLADRERRFRRLYESNLMGIVFYLPDGTLSDPNNAFLELLGYDRSALTEGLNWGTLVPPEWTHLDNAEQAKLELTGHCGPYEVEFTRRDGTRVPVLITGADLEPGSRSFGVASVVDLTHVKRVEEALRKTEAELRMANESLELRIQERTLELQHRSDQLRALALDLTETESRERKRLAQLLHDHFQQLVSAAKLKVGMVRRKLTDPALIETVTQVESLLEETINASRSLATELSPPVLHDAGLGAGLEWLVRRMEKDQNLTVNLTFDPGCEPDNEQVRTIVFECAKELLFNVVKHAGASSADLVVSMPAEGLLQVAVTDHGQGFDAHAMEMKAKPDGSFGLFSIKERLGLLGGLVRIRSQKGHGTTVSMTVPVTFKQSKDGTTTGIALDLPSVDAESRVPNVRVVVADDHRLFREGLISLITQESFVDIVGQANDGEEALAMARDLKPDILIVDVTMPKLNGVQVTNLLSHELPDIKVIGLSMHERDDMASAMRDAGAVAYCTKGGPTDALLNVLRSVASASKRN